MTAAEALRLTVAHNLGSSRNTLVPGVEVPAFTAGMNPDQWVSRVKAIGLSRLQPAGMETSQFKYSEVPMNTTIGSGPGRIMVPKNETEKEAAIQRLVSAMTPAANADGSSPSQFASGRWVYGNDFGGMQGNVLSRAQILENAAQAARRDAMAANAQAANQRLAQEQLDLQRQQVQQNFAVNQSSTDWTKKLALLDRIQQGQHLSFDEQLRLAQITGAQADEANISSLGREAVIAQANASKGLLTAEQAWNAKAAKLAAQANVKTVNRNGLLDFDSTNPASAAIMDQMGNEATALKAAHVASIDADTAAQQVRFTPRTKISVPTAPQSVFQGGDMNLSDLVSRLTGGGGQPQQTRSLAVPFVLQDAAGALSRLRPVSDGRGIYHGTAAGAIRPKVYTDVPAPASVSPEIVPAAVPPPPAPVQAGNDEELAARFRAIQEAAAAAAQAPESGIAPGDYSVTPTPTPGVQSLGAIASTGAQSMIHPEQAMAAVGAMAASELIASGYVPGPESDGMKAAAAVASLMRARIPVVGPNLEMAIQAIDLALSTPGVLPATAAAVAPGATGYQNPAVAALLMASQSRGLAFPNMSPGSAIQDAPPGAFAPVGAAAASAVGYNPLPASIVMQALSRLNDSKEGHTALRLGSALGTPTASAIALMRAAAKQEAEAEAKANAAAARPATLKSGKQVSIKRTK